MTGEVANSRCATRLGVFFAVVAAATTLAQAQPAHAEAPGLQLTPLQYVGDLTAGKAKSGYVDVANPSDSTVTIQSRVQAFRQTGTQGKLEFYDDQRYSEGIKVDLENFELGPREAVRVPFTVSPSKLPAGGVYAVIFFRTVPPAQSAASSYVAESANLGTLLELTNGPAGPHRGRVAAASFNFFQFGRGLSGSLSYENTDTTERPVGFRPALDVRLAPWAAPHRLTTGLVLPGSTREFAVSKPGSYLGVLAISITDTENGLTTTRWVLICTGWCQWVALVALLILILLVLLGRRLPRKFLGLSGVVQQLQRAIGRARRKKTKPALTPRRSLDGVVPRQAPIASSQTQGASSGTLTKASAASDVPTSDTASPSQDTIMGPEIESDPTASSADPVAEAVPVEFVDPILQAGQSEADPRTPAFKPLPESPLPAKKRRTKAAKASTSDKPAKSTKPEKLARASHQPKPRKKG